MQPKLFTAMASVIFAPLFFKRPSVLTAIPACLAVSCTVRRPSGIGRAGAFANFLIRPSRSSARIAGILATVSAL